MIMRHRQGEPPAFRLRTRTNALWREPEIAMQVETLPETGFRCPYCGEHLAADATECTKCDWVKGPTIPEEFRGPRNPRDKAALLLSVVPGAGHFFKGYRLAGAALLFAGVPIITLVAFTFTMFFGWLLVPGYWIVVAADAYMRKDLNLSPTPAPAPPLD
jgi:hypothetical protein